MDSASTGKLRQERLRLAIEFTLIQFLEEEAKAFVQAGLCQRTPERKDYRNGSYARDLGALMDVIEDLARNLHTS